MLAVCLQDEQGVLDKLFARGLMADLGLPSATIKTVMLVPGPSNGKEASSPVSGPCIMLIAMRQQLTCLAPSHCSSCCCSCMQGLVSRLGNLAARAGLTAATSAGKAGPPSTTIEIQRSSGGGKMTVFKPLGVVLSMGV